MSIILTVKESHENDRRIEASPVVERLVVLAKLEFSAFIFLYNYTPINSNSWVTLRKLAVCHQLAKLLIRRFG